VLFPGDSKHTGDGLANTIEGIGLGNEAGGAPGFGFVCIRLLIGSGINDHCNIAIK